MKNLLLILSLGMLGCSGCGEEPTIEFPIFGHNNNIEKAVITDTGATPLHEESLFVWQGDLYKVSFTRGFQLTIGKSVLIRRWDGSNFVKIVELPWPRLLGSSLLADNRLYIFGTTDVSQDGNSIVIQEIDLNTWEFIGAERNIHNLPGVRIYNTSATIGPHGYILLYETNEATAFSERFLQSDDLISWLPIGGLVNSDRYSGGPFIKYAQDGWYIFTHLQLAGNRDGFYIWETVMARTKDFVNLEYANKPFMSVTRMHYEGINLSDVDFIEWNGKVAFTYMTGDQSTWGFSSYAWYNGTLEDLYQEYWN